MKRVAGSSDYLELARAVLRLSRHLYRTFDAALGPPFGLGTKDFLVLRVIQDGQPHPGRVAACLNMPPASVSRVLQRLRAKGYVQRSVDPADRRRFRLAVTDAGERAVEAMREVMRQALSGSYAQVPAAVLRDAVAQLSTLNDAIDRRH